MHIGQEERKADGGLSVLGCPGTTFWIRRILLRLWVGGVWEGVLGFPEPSRRRVEPQGVQ